MEIIYKLEKNNLYCKCSIKKSKIIILDEVTSSLDYNTEKIINEKYGKNF